MGKDAPVGVLLVVDPEVEAAESVSRVALDPVVRLGLELCEHVLVKPGKLRSETKVGFVRKKYFARCRKNLPENVIH